MRSAGKAAAGTWGNGGLRRGDTDFGATCGHIVRAIPEGSLELSGHWQPLGELLSCREAPKLLLTTPPSHRVSAITRSQPVVGYK